MQRTITYILTKNKSKKDFDLLVKLCHNSKNLYNFVNYIIRQAFTNKSENISQFNDLVSNKRFISEFDLSKRLAQLNQTDYRSLKSQVSQQVIKQVYKNYKSFFRSIQEYKKNKLKFKGCPKLPKYKDKHGLNVVQFTNQCVSFDKNDHCLKLDKQTKIKSIVYPFEDIRNFKQIRIIPKNNYFQIEVVIEKMEGKYTQQAKEINKKTINIGIDIGVNNLATITSDNMELQPLIINGRSLKSINQFYNKQIAKIQHIYSKQNIKTGQKLKKLNMKRTMKINDYLHKASRRIVDYCILNNVKSVYIGHNKSWKQNANMNKQNNQNFVQIPFNSFIQKLKYKLEEVGIEIKQINEAYSSRCSSLDNEIIEKHNKYAGSRIKRGLFKSNIGKLINADVNGSLNILRLGLNINFEIKNKLNPIKIKKINELNDICYFSQKNDKSIDRGCVFQPNNN